MDGNTTNDADEVAAGAPPRKKRSSQDHGVNFVVSDAPAAGPASSEPAAPREGMRLRKKWLGSGWYLGTVIAVKDAVTSVQWDEGSVTTMAAHVAMRHRHTATRDEAAMAEAPFNTEPTETFAHEAAEATATRLLAHLPDPQSHGELVSALADLASRVDSGAASAVSRLLAAALGSAEEQTPRALVVPDLDFGRGPFANLADGRAARSADDGALRARGEGFFAELDADAVARRLRAPLPMSAPSLGIPDRPRAMDVSPNTHVMAGIVADGESLAGQPAAPLPVGYLLPPAGYWEGGCSEGGARPLIDAEASDGVSHVFSRASSLRVAAARPLVGAEVHVGALMRRLLFGLQGRAAACPIDLGGDHGDAIEESDVAGRIADEDDRAGGGEPLGSISPEVGTHGSLILRFAF